MKVEAVDTTPQGATSYSGFGYDNPIISLDAVLDLHISTVKWNLYIHRYITAATGVPKRHGLPFQRSGIFRLAIATFDSDLRISNYY